MCSGSSDPETTDEIYLLQEQIFDRSEQLGFKGEISTT